MPLRERQKEPLNWKLIAVLAAIPLPLLPLAYLLPVGSSGWTGWVVLLVGLAIELVRGLVIVRKAVGGTAMLHGFIVGAVSSILIELGGLVLSPQQRPFSTGFKVLPSWVIEAFFRGSGRLLSCG